MKLREIRIPTSWEVHANYKLIEIETSRILVIEFPGANYGTEKPLFHYIRKQALLLGIDVLSLEYGYKVSRTVPDWDEDLFNKITRDILNALDEISISKYDKVIFVSKSIGTVIAGKVEQTLSKEVYQIYLTPINSSLPYITRSKDCTVILGDKDPNINITELHKLHENGLPVILISDGNHTLETNNINRTIDILKEIIEQCRGIFCEQLKQIDGIV